MIQRIQTLWLLLAGIGSLLTLQFPFYTGNTHQNLFAQLNSQSNFLMLVLAVAIALLALITIFLYRNRKLQLRLSLLALTLSALLLFLLFREIGNFKPGEGGIHLWSVLYFAVPVCLLLAMRGIFKDEQLIKQMDRLR